MPEHQDYYKLLHVSENADIEEIKRSFRRLVRDCHPDLHPNDAKAAERFRLLREAYEVLTDAAQRSRYDRGRQKSADSNRDQETSPQVHYVRGVEKILVQNYRGAIADLSAAIRLNSRFIEAYLKRCEAYLALGEERAVLEDCQRILRYQPDSAIAYYYRGRARQRLGYTDSAVKAYSQAIRLNQDFPSPYYYRGVANYQLRYRKRAISDWRDYADICKQQGNIEGYNLAMDTLERYTGLQIRIGGRSIGQWWRSGTQSIERLLQRVSSRSSQLGRSGTQQIGRLFQNRRRDSSQVFSTFQNQLGAIFTAVGLGIQTFLKTLLQVMRNPVGGVLPAYGALEPKTALAVALGFIILGESCFLVGISSRFDLTLSVIFGGLGVGMIPILSIFVISIITRSVLNHDRHWTGDLFLASSAVLPLEFFFFLTTFSPFLPNLFLFILFIFPCSQTILLLYGGCSQLLNVSESLAALLVPTIVVVTTLLTVLGISILL